MESEVEEEGKPGHGGREMKQGADLIQGKKVKAGDGTIHHTDIWHLEHLYPPLPAQTRPLNEKHFVDNNL